MKPLEIIIVLDTSYSMERLLGDNVGQVNEYLKDELEKGLKAKVTLYTFSNEVTQRCNRVKLEDMKPLVGMKVDGSTCLTDAIGHSITHAKPDRDTIMMIFTDGQENCSCHYQRDQVAEMVKSKQAAGWDINFFGVGIDAALIGGAYNFKADKMVNLGANVRGMEMGKSLMAQTTTMYAGDHYSGGAAGWSDGGDAGGGGEC